MARGTLADRAPTEYVPHSTVEAAEFYTDYMAMYTTTDGAIDVLSNSPVSARTTHLSAKHALQTP
ncbi:MAG: hypothetical protein ACQSGP_23765 [Frankia sp.]